jgi:hypothetical protein
MFTAKLAAGALAIALLAMTAPLSPSGAAPGVTPAPAQISGMKTSAITLVRKGGGHGFSGGGRGFSSRGFGGGNRAMRFNGGGNRAMRFGGGGSRKFAHGHGVPRAGFHINPRYAGKHHHHHHHKHRRHRFPVVLYGAPYYADAYVADFLGDDCEELYYRAVNTNSRYWWNRYYECRDGD